MVCCVYRKIAQQLGLDGKGDAEIVSLKIRDSSLVDVLLQQPGYLRNYPSSGWGWVSVVLDGTVSFEDICRWMDESYSATISKTKNKKVPLAKRG